MNTDGEPLGRTRAKRVGAGDHRIYEGMISYAQNAEDVLLRRLFPPNHVGFYIDVGANHPTIDSMTRYFYDRGWRGINVEPTPHYHRLLSKERRRDTNLCVGISNENTSATLFETDPPTGLSTFSKEVAQEHTRNGFRFRARETKLITLATLCEEHSVSELDFLSIDAEGFERHILEGADFRRWRPVAVVIEAVWPNRTEATHADWEPLIVEAGYLFATFDGIGRYYIREEDAHLVERLVAPACVFDNFIPYRYLVWRREADELRAELERIKKWGLMGRAWNRLLGRRR